MTTGRLLARNSALNVLGHVAPLIVAVLAIPPLVRGLGPERFGVLSLAWATIGYFGLFELGLGRALTQAVARRLGNGRNDELPGVTRRALSILLLLGGAGGVVLALAAGPLVNVLKVPGDLRHEALVSFRLLAVSLPFVLGTVGMRGIMEAHQHFGLATALRVPLGVLSFLAPLFVLPFSRSLIPSVAALVVGRVLGFAVHMIACWRRYPYITAHGSTGPSSIRELLHFGGWTTVSNLASPLMVYADRFIIGSVIGLAAVTSYVTPLEVVIKVLLISGAMSGVFLPALSSTFEAQRQRMFDLYDRSLRANMLVTFPIVLGIVVLGDIGLRIWMGDALPAESARILQWLAVGVFVTAVAQAPHTALQSAARPDLIAKIHLLEIPFYAAMLAAFLKWRGLEGAAIAWTARTILDAVMLLWVAHRRLGIPLFPRLGGAWSLVLMLTTLGLGFSLVSPAAKTLYVALVGGLFVTASWRFLLTESERQAIRQWAGRRHLGAYGNAAVVALLLIGMTACEPCSTTLGCNQAPRISISGQILDEESGRGIRSRIELRRESGIPFENVMVETGSSGAFDLSSEHTESGQAIARLTVSPEGQRPFIVRSIPVSTLTTKGDAIVMPPWSRPTLPYALHITRASDNSSLEGAVVRFQRTAGPEMLVGGASVSFVAETTGPGAFIFPFRDVTLDSTGVVTGTLSVQTSGMPSPFRQSISFTVFPHYRLRHAELAIVVTGL